MACSKGSGLLKAVHSPLVVLLIEFPRSLRRALLKFDGGWTECRAVSVPRVVAEVAPPYGIRSAGRKSDWRPDLEIIMRIHLSMVSHGPGRHQTRYFQ